MESGSRSLAARLCAGLSVVVSLALVIFVLAPAIPARAAGVVYVKPGGTGDGSSWANAADLAPALLGATSGDELWVAAGIYRPTTPAGRDATFQLKDGVAIYGGFAGTELARAQRDWATNVVTLSGDLGGDDTASFGNRTDNSYHVVTGADGATLDGVTVSGGFAGDAGANGIGGGIYNVSSSPTLSNLIITDNWAWTGAGMYNTASSPTLTWVTFSYNNGDDAGGMYNGAGSDATLTNVVFFWNITPHYGGAMYNSASSPTLTNVTMSGNSADYGGDALYNTAGSNPAIRNSVIWGNYYANNAITNESATTASAPAISSTLLQYSGGSGAGWVAANGVDGGGNLDQDPRFVSMATGNLRLLSDSPARDAGDNGVAGPALPATDRFGNPRIVSGTVDMGAHEVVPLVLAIARAGASPTSAATVDFVVTFNMDVTGVDASDFATAGDLTGASVDDVTGSGSSYSVTVSAGSGAGQLRLDLVDDNSIANTDPAPVPLGGADPGDGGFTGGEAYTVDRLGPTVSLNPAPAITSVNMFSYAVSGACSSGDGAVSIQVGAVSGSATCFGDSFFAFLNVSSLADGGAIAVSASQSDAAGNTGSASQTVVKDTLRPGVTLSSAATGSTAASPIAVTVSFGESVSGFTQEDVGVVNATLGDFSGSGSSYSFTLTPLGQGAVSATVVAGAAQDAAGNTNLTSNTLVRIYDSVAPSVGLTAPGPITAANQAGYMVAGGCASGDGSVSVQVGAVSRSATCVGGSFSASLDVSGLADGGAIAVSAGQTDAAGNPGGAAATVAKDTVAPTVEMSSTASDPTNLSSITVMVSFSEAVEGFTAADIAATNATVGGFTGSGAVYSFTLTPLAEGPVSAAIAAGAAGDAVGNPSAAASFSRAYDPSALAMTLASSAPATTNVAPIPFTVTFGQPVADFTAEDLGLTNATLASFTGGGTSFSFALTPQGDGPVGVAIAAGAAHDSAGNASGGASLTRIYDTTGPAGHSMGGAEPPAVGSAVYSFSVVLGDNLGLDLASLGDGDVIVRGPGGYEAPATLVGHSAGAPLVATFSVPAPGGSWDGADSGVYTVSLVAGAIADRAGNLAPGAEIGSFAVELGGRVLLPLVVR